MAEILLLLWQWYILPFSFPTDLSSLCLLLPPLLTISYPVFYTFSSLFVLLVCSGCSRTSFTRVHGHMLNTPTHKWHKSTWSTRKVFKPYDTPENKATMYLEWRRTRLHTSCIAVCVCLLSVGGAAGSFSVPCAFSFLFFKIYNSSTSTVHFPKSPPPSLHQPRLEALHFMPLFVLCSTTVLQSSYTTATIWQAYHQHCLQS